MSGVQESISCPSPNHPAGPFETQSDVKNPKKPNVIRRK